MEKTIMMFEGSDMKAIVRMLKGHWVSPDANKARITVPTKLPEAKPDKFVSKASQQVENAVSAERKGRYGGKTFL